MTSTESGILARKLRAIAIFEHEATVPRAVVRVLL